MGPIIMADAMLDVPREVIDEARSTISNFDGGSIADGVEDDLRSGKYAQHCAWDHWGMVWFSDGKFHEKVMRYGRHLATLSDTDLKGLIREVNAEYGSG